MKYAWIALVVVSWWTFAYSQPPLPTPAEAANEPKQQSENEAKKVDVLSCPSAQQAPSVVCTSSPNIHLETPGQKDDTNNNASYERWGVLFAGGLLVVAVFQLLTYRRQANLLETQADILSQQKGIMESGLAATEKAANAADRSATAAIGVELPRLILSHLDFAPTGTEPGPWNTRLQYPNIVASVRNYGRTPAFIKSKSLDIKWGSLPQEPNYSEHAVDVEPETVVEARDIYSLGDMRPRPSIAASETEAIEKGQMYLWAYGYVAYKDFLGNPHLCAFCKRLVISPNGRDHRFVDMDDNPKYTQNY